ncbi:MAG: hypothetical protein ACOX36_07585 [Saccharofermentanales bacterium]
MSKGDFDDDRLQDRILLLSVDGETAPLYHHTVVLLLEDKMGRHRFTRL